MRQNKIYERKATIDVISFVKRVSEVNCRSIDIVFMVIWVIS